MFYSGPVKVLHISTLSFKVNTFFFDQGAIKKRNDNVKPHVYNMHKGPPR